MKRTIYLLISLLIFSTAAIALTVNEAIQQSVTTHPDVLRFVKQCKANREALRGAHSGFYPTLDLTAGYGVERTSNPNVLLRTNKDHRNLMRREFGAEARQMVYDGHATSYEVDRVKFKTNASAWLVAAIANDVALDVAEAYVNVLRTRTLVASARENLEIHQKTSNMISKRSESGISRQADAVQARGRLDQARSNLKSSEGHLRDAEINYFRLVGDKPVRLSKPNLARRKLPRNEDEAVRLSIKNHPKIKSADFDILEAHALHHKMKSPMLPKVEIVLGANQNRHIDGVYGQNDDYYAMVRGRWNLFNGGADYARHKETAYYVQEAAEIRNRAFRQVIENARLAWVSYEVNKDVIEDYKHHLVSSQDTVEAYAKQFQLGQRTLLDLLNSENEYFSAKKELVNSQYDLVLAKYRILHSLGALLNCVDMSKLGLSTDLTNVMKYPDMGAFDGGYVEENIKHDFGFKRTKYDYSKPEAEPATKSETKVKPDEKAVQTRETVPKENVGQQQANYSIQLLGTPSKSEIKNFVEKNKLQNKSISYHSYRKDGKHWYSLVMGQYKTRKEALVAVKQLPSELKVFHPWPIQMKTMLHANKVDFSKVYKA